MNRSGMWLIGVAGLTLGLVSVAGGGVLGAELAPLARGYGMLVVGAAVYMLGGLTLRDLLRRSARSAAPEGARSTRPASQS
jgi:hypothetical protein